MKEKKKLRSVLIASALFTNSLRINRNATRVDQQRPQEHLPQQLLIQQATIITTVEEAVKTPQQSQHRQTNKVINNSIRKAKDEIQ